VSPPDESGRLRGLATEQARPELAELDLLTSAELVALMCADVDRVPEAVAAAQPSIALAVDAIVARMERGGRLIYVGAGTAGRVGMLDAAEAGPTFNVEPGQVVGVLAGGPQAWSVPAENAEDDADRGAAEVASLAVAERDVLVGIAASGRTPFVLGAVEAANVAGALTVALVCNRDSPLAGVAQLAIEVIVGPEVIAGSTRLNAGTAQKVVLNIISTTTMVRLGKTYGPLMVDLRATNAKLRDRATRIVCEITGREPADARAALEQAGWRSKVAAVMLAGSVGRDRAVAELERHGGRLRPALLALAEPRGPETRASVPGAGRRLGVAAAVIDGRLVPGDVEVRGGEIEAFGLGGPGRGIAIPGLVDAQVNGYAGVDVLAADGDELVALGRALLRDGVRAYQPTLITAPEEDTIAALRRIASLPAGPHDAAIVVGVHLEGPFLSPERAGAHPREHLRAPDVGLLERLLDAGPVRTVTLAPELPGALDLIATCVRRGVTVWLGHGQPQAAEVIRALDAGASAVTHLFNAMAPVSARAAGLAGTALARTDCAIQLIADGVHVADELVRLAFAAAPGRCSLVSDAISAAGLPDGSYPLGPVTVEVTGHVARRPDGTLAGSVVGLAGGLEQLHRIGIEPAEAIAAVTERPARILGEPSRGRLWRGGPADIVVVGEGHELQRVIAGGVEL
jgi:N-acetylmuramic acid 6-phosphate etherase/N-acetylglucosamine-6-phosphate deacetylase